MPIGPTIKIGFSVTAPTEAERERVRADVMAALTAAGYPPKQPTPPPPSRPALRVIRGSGGHDAA